MPAAHSWTESRVCRTGVRPLPQSFYARDARLVARDLIGCCLVRREPQVLVAQIVETEAYLPGDPASHSFRGLTARNAVMFGPAGYAYVYLIYGNHHCLNVVTGERGHGAAVLLRAAVPLAGIAAMAWNRGLTKNDTRDTHEVRDGRNTSVYRRNSGTSETRPGSTGLSQRQMRNLCNGPGKLAQAFGITREAHNGCILFEARRAPLVLSANVPAGGLDRSLMTVVQDRRVGISRAVEEQWRYLTPDSGCVSRKPGPNARDAGELPGGESRT